MESSVSRNCRDDHRGRGDLPTNSSLGLKWARLVRAVEWSFGKVLRTKMREEEEGHALDKMVWLGFI